MNYFKHLPATLYLFGEETLPVTFRNISVYASILDEVKDNLSFYNDYHIQEFERPDQVSYKLYSTPNFHWTFYLLNDKLKDSGWPLSNREVMEKIYTDYPNKVITTKDNISSKFQKGQTITGLTSGATATIDHRHVSLGQLVLTNVTKTFLVGEIITNTALESVTVKSFEDEYNSTHHYEDANGDWKDLEIDSVTGNLNDPGASWTEVTYMDRLYNQNEELKQIRVIKPSQIVNLVNAFKEAVR